MTYKTNAEFLKQAKQDMPLGVAENYRYWGEDETLFVESMKGCTLTDCEGREFVDFRLGYGPIILGYRDERVDQAVIDAITKHGVTSGFSSVIDHETIELIKELCPNIEKLRFANSGTEAVMGALRTARGFTGRETVIVVEGGFHGLFDEMMWRSDIEGWDKDQKSAPEVIAFGAGLPKSTQALTEFVPLNDLQALLDVFERAGDTIAAVLLEPIMGNCGSISATQQYMEQLRDICTRNGSLLIMDEVKTGFRVALGGAQELYGVQADLSTYAKAIGNGYPVAVFGGRADVMDTIGHGKENVVHGGTYTANLIAMSAARKTLDILKNTDAMSTIMRRGKEIRELLSRVFTSYDIAHSFAGPDSMFGIHFSPDVPQNYRDWKATNAKLYDTFAWNLIHRGVMLEPDSREPWFICEAHQTIDLAWLEDTCSQAMRDAIQTMKL